jgi:hypothetical protein
MSINQSDDAHTVRVQGRVIGHYAPARYRRDAARAWRCVTTNGHLGYACDEASAARWLIENNQTGGQTKWN